MHQKNASNNAAKMAKNALRQWQKCKKGDTVTDHLKYINFAI